MKSVAQWLGSAIVAVVVILFSANRPAFADTYRIYDLGDDNSHGIWDRRGGGGCDLVERSGGGFPPYCYVTYTNGVAANDGRNSPILAL